MDRHFRESLRHLRRLATAAELSGEKLSGTVQPFIEQWRTPRVPNRKNAIPTNEAATLTASALANLPARIRTLGANLHKSGLKGIHYHNTFGRHLAALAPEFDCRGFTESAAIFDDPDTVKESTPSQVAGRVDVIWARHKVVVAVFEIDSTVKARSFQKLKEAAAAHRCWVYFGKDVWAFRSFLQRTDPRREVTPVIVPFTFVPSFEMSSRTHR